MISFMSSLSPPPNHHPLHSLLIRFIVLLVVSCKTKAVVKLPPNVSVPAVIVFGDSIVDTGNNNNNLRTTARCNFPPYGKDFKGGMPTGRFSNGKVPSDLIETVIVGSGCMKSVETDMDENRRKWINKVEELGIKEFLPAYLDPNLQPGDLPTGVNFASGGAGYDPLTSETASAVSLSGQLDLFKEYIGKLRGLVGEDRTKFILANGLFLVVLGSNDISNTYFLSRIRQVQYDFPAYADLMVTSASNFLKELYQLGARRIGVFSAPPVGCLPFQRTAAGGTRRNIVVKYNDAVELYNSKLSKGLDSFNHNYPNSRIVYVDVYTPLLDIILNFKKYGYKVGDRGCCGTGIIEVVFLCNSLVPTCPNDMEFVFWDSFHPTESVYKRLIAPIVQKYAKDFI